VKQAHTSGKYVTLFIEIGPSDIQILNQGRLPYRESEGPIPFRYSKSEGNGFSTFRFPTLAMATGSCIGKGSTCIRDLETQARTKTNLLGRESFPIVGEGFPL